RIGQALQRARHRPLDLVARYGGEEVVCVLADTDRDGAIAVAENLRAAVTALAIGHPDPNAGDFVSVSLGVAAMVPGESQSVDDLISAADDALYEAKRQGRDRVCTA
ncbi:MAG TPA: diguanylate cyclase, partial [Arenimonas sp.]|nr:diguanylate cyclase [Arenimonas sp.]